MEQSYFFQLVAKWFPGLVLDVIELLNGTQEGQDPYLHKTMLEPDYSVTGKWESLKGSYTRIMADYVAMDSSLPLKKRDSLGTASGKIPKMGLELKLNEEQLTNLRVIEQQPGRQSALLKKLFEDTPRVIQAIYETNEATFLEGLSTGECNVTDTENRGVIFRVSYGYPAANKAGASVLWSNATTAKPIDDIKRVMAKRKTRGVSTRVVMMDSFAFDNMVKTTQFKEEFAFSIGYGGQLTSQPTVDQANTLLNSKFRFTIQLVDRSVRYEKSDGTQVDYKPWANGMVVFLSSTQVGSLVYARLAEQDYPVANVAYQEAEDYILVSKFRENRPSLAEFTQSQARVLPVISGVEDIDTLDTTTLQL